MFHCRQLGCNPMEKLWEKRDRGQYLPSTAGLTRAQGERASASRKDPQTELREQAAGSGVGVYETMGPAASAIARSSVTCKRKASFILQEASHDAWDIVRTQNLQPSATLLLVLLTSNAHYEDMVCHIITSSIFLT